MFAFKSQKSKSYIINTVACCLHKEKDVKKTVRKKIGKSFLKRFCFISYSFKNNNILRLCVSIVFNLFTYALFEVAIEKKCLLNICLFKSSKILEKYLRKIYCKVVGCRSLSLLKLTLSQIYFKSSANITYYLVL